MSPFPIAPRHVYSSSEMYFLSNLDEAEYICAADPDNVDQYTNALCLDTTGRAFQGGKHVTVGDGGVDVKYSSCDTLPKRYCQRPVELWDMSLSSYTDLCVFEEGFYCSSLTVHNDIKRPSDKKQRYDDTITRWYVGDHSYVTGYDYFCMAHDNIDGYYNVLCDSEGSFDNLDVFCSNNVSRQTDDEHVTQCSIIKCIDMPIEWCSGGLDLYKVADGMASLVYTCEPDSLGGCKTRSTPSTESPTSSANESFNPPSNYKNSKSQWWYVGSTAYDDTTTYTCDDDQNIGTEDSPYINVVCDTAYTGSLVTGDNITCKSNVTSGLSSDRSIDCSATQCSDMPIKFCANPTDLYVYKSGTSPSYTATCTLSKDGDICETSVSSGVVTSISTITLLSVSAIFSLL